jgi:hypothetical protein
MFRKGRTHWLAAVVAAVLLATSLRSAEAAGGRAEGGMDLWSRLFEWLTAAVTQPSAEGSSMGTNGRSVGSIWAKEGSSIDPFGRPASAQSDAGSSIDPFGGK